MDREALRSKCLLDQCLWTVSFNTDLLIEEPSSKLIQGPVSLTCVGS